MKKLLAILLVLTMVLSLAACGNKPNNGNEPTDLQPATDDQFAKEKAEYLAMTPEQLQEKYIKDPTAVTTEEYIALVSTLKYTDIKDDEKKGKINLEDNPTETLYKTLNKAKAFNGIDGEVAFKALAANEWAQVRGFALANTKTKFSKLKYDETKTLLADEKVPYVLVRILPLIYGTDLGNPDVVNFIKRAAKDDSKYVRMNTAALLGGFKKDQFDGIVDLMKDLMQDSDKDVKSKALINSGRLYDESVIDILEAVLKDKSQRELHEDALSGLSYLWYDYATHRSTNERAYRVTMDYYKTAFTDPDEKYNNELDALGCGKSENSFEDWRKRATYYNTDEIAQIMVSIITNPNAPFGAKSDAIRAMEVHCSKAQLEANKSKVEAAINDNFALKTQYQTVLDKAK